MDKFIKIIFIFLFILELTKLSFGDDPEEFVGEITFVNRTNSDCFVKSYPISMVFNKDSNYCLIARNRWNSPTKNTSFDYNNGVYLLRNLPDTNLVKKTVLKVPAGQSRDLQFDLSDEDGGYGSFGYGKYKVVFATDEELYDIVDTLTMEYDAGYGESMSPDVKIFYNNQRRISFYWGGMDPVERNISDSDVNRKIECWNQYENGSRAKRISGFSYKTLDYNYYTNFPQDSRRDCDVITGVWEQNHIFEDNRSGVLTFNLSVEKDIYTPNVLKDNPTYIVVMKKASIVINSSKIFEMTTPSSPSGGYTNLIVEDSAYLTLRPGSNIIVYSPNRITLKYNSNLTFNISAGSVQTIRFKPGSLFCNEGAILRGPGGTIFEAGYHNICRPDNGIITYSDSAKLILDSNAVLEVPDSTTLKFKGNQTALKLTPTSKLKMGVNSKLVFEDGARMIFRNSTLIAKDTTKKWGGIFSYDDSPDTIVNTKIINAVDGINLIDKFNQPNIIQDCEFINKCSSGLNTGIYIYNSEKTLIRGNHFYSETSGKFDNAVYLEYCTSNELNVIDNTIQDSDNGIIDIGSWSYIARNTITGDEGEGCGIYLDNYSGNVKYNIIENFENNLFTLVSDAYLYRNIFQNASIANLELESYSIPLLRPIVSGELKYWVGGDNTIDISDNGVGINLEDESYPHIKDGYNKFYLNGADYFITGDIPEEFEESFEAENNFWDLDESPSKYQVSVSSDPVDVDYSPTDDGSPGNREFNTIIPMDIGFGLWDTINILDMSDNPIITDLFMLGNNKLISGNYEDAIEDFKDVVESNDTMFTNLALKKIYYCYERSNFFGSNFTDAKDYFEGINSDTNNAVTSRGIAKDMYLKVKFKNGEYESASDEYNTMYMNNQNNALGLHALINKTILENLAGGDNFGGEQTSPENIAEHKKQVLQLLNPNDNSAKKGIHAKTLTAESFNLEQNYPNPFNPTTNLEFGISELGFVSLKVYDVLGKEVANLIDEKKSAGRYKITFDGSNLPSGVYFYKLETGDFSIIKKMILIK